MKRLIYMLLPALLLGAACARVPQGALLTEAPARIWPDYSEIAVPCNIAPLNFRIEDEAQAYRCVARGEKGKAIVVKGRTARFPLKEWHALLEANKGGEISFEIYEKRDGRWYACPPVRNFVAPDPVDRYLSYRLIEPTYGWRGL